MAECGLSGRARRVLVAGLSAVALLAGGACAASTKAHAGASTSSAPTSAVAGAATSTSTAGASSTTSVASSTSAAESAPTTVAPGGGSGGSTTTAAGAACPAGGPFGDLAGASAFIASKAVGPGAEAGVHWVAYPAADQHPYSASADLAVVLATVPHATGGSLEQAFFFSRGCYLGTATATPREGVSVVSATPTKVVLQWLHWRSSDPICCPGGTPWQVTFTWQGHLVTSGTFPPENQGI